MPRRHIVKPGDCLVRIAARYGFADHQKLWEHPDNQGLSRKGRTPHALMPGDVVVVPDPEPKTVSLATGSTYRCVAKVPRKQLALKLVGAQKEAWANERYVLEVEGLHEPREGTTDQDGRLSEVVPLQAREATLTIRERKFRLRLGYMVPLPADEAESAAGAASRLRNLGYEPGSAHRLDSPVMRMALALFQKDNGMEPTGQLDAATAGKLREVHGS